MVRKLERALLPNTGASANNNMIEAARPTDAQRKALALLCDLVEAGDDGIPIGNLIYGPQHSTPGGKVTDALWGLDEAGAIHHSDTSGAWHATCLGQLAVAHARAAGHE